MIDAMRRLAEREIAQADAAAARTNDGRDRTRALRARHDRLRCALLAALPAEMASAAFVSRLERFFLNHPEVFNAALLDDLTSTSRPRGEAIVPPETRQKSPVARAMALRDAVNQALTGPSDLKPFERELRNWANAEVQAAVLARAATGSPARKAVAVGDSPVAEARPSFFRDFFGEDAGAIIEDYRQGA